MISIITFSTSGGTLNVLMSFGTSKWYIQLVVGFFGLLTAILSAVHNFLDVPESQERHNMYSSGFGQIVRAIDMEIVLANTKNESYASLGEFIKIIKNDIDRLISNAPPIPEHLLDETTILTINDGLSVNDLCEVQIERSCAPTTAQAPTQEPTPAPPLGFQNVPMSPMRKRASMDIDILRLEKYKKNAATIDKRVELRNSILTP